MAPIDWGKVAKINNQIIDIESNIEDYKDNVKDLKEQKREMLKQRKTILGIADDESITGEKNSGNSKASHVDEHISEGEQAKKLAEDDKKED